MGFLVRLFTTENFSELLSSKVQGYTSLDSTTVEFFLWEAFSPMCFSSELPSLKFSQNQKGVYIVWLQRCLWPEEKGLFQYDKKKLIMAIPQWREEMNLSNRSLKRWEMIIVCLFLVLFQERRICAILQQEILWHPEVVILQSIWFSIWAHSVSKIRYPNTLHVVWECTFQ